MQAAVGAGRFHMVPALSYDCMRFRMTASLITAWISGQHNSAYALSAGLEIGSS